MWEFLNNISKVGANSPGGLSKALSHASLSKKIHLGILTIFTCLRPQSIEPHMPRNCSNIPFWGLSLYPCFLDTGIEGTVTGQGHPMSQCQSWEYNPDFLTPWPVPWPESHMLLTSEQAVCLCVPSALRERNVNPAISSPNLHKSFISSANRQVSLDRSSYLEKKQFLKN